MKKITLILFLLMGTSIFDSSSNLVAAKPIKSDYQQDLIFTLINPSIFNALVGFYGTPKTYDLTESKILEIERIGSGFNFRVKVLIETYTGPHNPPYGHEKITMQVNLTSVLIEKFEHTQSD
ncbi:DUF3888 domain-containing protein [Cohnella terricola]|uniref:DUF3888 domain-containing protein n=1 Tax=Cohnella terricola TaxID=1289167 RepID=A0A559JQL2_9BACL|nr:DUF3888 domain-containing protein [Cohnella terricola]TVY02171.1 DUF3888 domain-containing protein [Cohnella terricola]